MKPLTELASLRATHGREENEYESAFEPETATLWGYFNPQGAPRFSLSLLADIRAHDSALQAANGHVLHEGAMHKVNYYVAASRVPGIYNLGGDLSLFLLRSEEHTSELQSH